MVEKSDEIWRMSMSESLMSKTDFDELRRLGFARAGKNKFIILWNYNVLARVKSRKFQALHVLVRITIFSIASWQPAIDHDDDGITFDKYAGPK